MFLCFFSNVLSPPALPFIPQTVTLISLNHGKPAPVPPHTMCPSMDILAPLTSVSIPHLPSRTLVSPDEQHVSPTPILNPQVLMLISASYEAPAQVLLCPTSFPSVMATQSASTQILYLSTRTLASHNELASPDKSLISHLTATGSTDYDMPVLPCPTQLTSAMTTFSPSLPLTLCISSLYKLLRIMDQQLKEE